MSQPETFMSKVELSGVAPETVRFLCLPASGKLNSVTLADVSDGKMKQKIESILSGIEEPVSKREISPKLKELIEKMNETVEDHVDVYPPLPKPENIVIPTGGLAKCRCSPNCQKELLQPAYHLIGVREERWCLNEKKKNSKRGRKKKKR